MIYYVILVCVLKSIDLDPRNKDQRSFLQNSIFVHSEVPKGYYETLQTLGIGLRPKIHFV